MNRFIEWFRPSEIGMKRNVERLFSSAMLPYSAAPHRRAAITVAARIIP